MVDYLEGVTRSAVGSGEVLPFRGGERQHELAERGRLTIRLSADPRFVKLRRRFAVQTTILIVVFLGWYLAYLFLSIYARDLMGVQVYGVINVALIMGVGQFASTLVLAWGYCLYAARRLDPLAAELRAESAAAEVVLNGRVRQG